MELALRIMTRLLYGLFALIGFVASPANASELDSLRAVVQTQVLDLMDIRDSLEAQIPLVASAQAIALRGRVIEINQEIRRIQPSLNVDSLKIAMDAARATRRNRIDSVYRSIEARIDAERAARQREMEARWGNYWESRKTFWVSEQDATKRVSINFEDGTIEAEVLASDDPEAVQNAEDVLVESFQTATKDIEDQLPESMRQEAGVRQAIHKENESTHKVRLKLNTKLISGSTKKRLEKYLPLYTSASARHNLDLALALAVGRAESAFFARAISRPHKGGHSYGLMQIVHVYAGTQYLDAHLSRQKAFYRQAEDAESNGIALSDFVQDYWFQPETNIDAGVWYLSYLANLRSIRELADLDKRRYLQICAYNAGPGNVDRYILRPLRTKIQRMDADALLNYILNESRMPDETRKYLRNVERYRKQFQSMLVAETE